MKQDPGSIYPDSKIIRQSSRLLQKKPIPNLQYTNAALQIPQQRDGILNSFDLMQLNSLSLESIARDQQNSYSAKSKSKITNSSSSSFFNQSKNSSPPLYCKQVQRQKSSRRVTNYFNQESLNAAKNCFSSTNKFIQQSSFRTNQSKKYRPQFNKTLQIGRLNHKLNELRQQSRLQKTMKSPLTANQKLKLYQKDTMQEQEFSRGLNTASLIVKPQISPSFSNNSLYASSHARVTKRSSQIHMKLNNQQFSQPTTASSSYKKIKPSPIRKVFTDEELIPCLYLRNKSSSKLLIYFHANAQDIGATKELLEFINKYLNVSTVAVEYPGYGVYTTSRVLQNYQHQKLQASTTVQILDSHTYTNQNRKKSFVCKKLEPSQQRIQQDANCVFSMFNQLIGIKKEDIIVMGRSIGTGPAIWLAAQRNPGALALISPPSSIRGIVRDLFGLGYVAQFLVNQRFRNLQTIKNVKSSTFILHGMADKLIPPSHSQLLKQNCGSDNVVLIQPENMDHNYFDIKDELCKPLRQFLRNINSRAPQNYKYQQYAKEDHNQQLQKSQNLSEVNKQNESMINGSEMKVLKAEYAKCSRAGKGQIFNRGMKGTRIMGGMKDEGGIQQRFAPKRLSSKRLPPKGLTVQNQIKGLNSDSQMCIKNGFRSGQLLKLKHTFPQNIKIRLNLNKN